MFLPPTLVASIYGMNFQFMPELDEHWGYPMALLAMAVSAVVPYIYFRRKGWL
jgi:magnesium transporter